MNERTLSLIGENNFNKIKSKQILVVGIGGVGGTSVEALVRSGAENLTIIDYDVFEESNLNRQILANKKNINQSKVDICSKHMLEINPNIKIKALNIFLNNDNINILEKYDYIIDACDTINTKVLLIKYALEHDIKIISSMGTGKRLDPRKLKISTLNKTYNDPLAKVMRKSLKDKNLPLNIPVVFSEELPIDNKTTISSMIFVPSSAGLLLAYYVINDIIEKE